LRRRLGAENAAAAEKFNQAAMVSAFLRLYLDAAGVVTPDRRP
jgi:hypothetical protein